MITFIFRLLLVNSCEALEKVPDNILYYELVDYNKRTVSDQHSRHKRDLSSSLSIAFHAFDRPFRLKLSKNNDVFTEDVKFTSSSGKDIIYDFYSLVKGTVNDESDSIAHGSLHEGLFEGVITSGNETYHIESANKYHENPQKHSMIYRLSDVLMNETNNKCGVKDEQGKHFSIPNESLFGPEWLRNGKLKYHKKREASSGPVQVKYCPLYMAADYKFYKQHSSSFAPAILSKLGTYVQEINKIFYETVFPSYNYRVKFLIRKAHVYDTPDNIYDKHEYAVAKFLDVFSTKDENQLNPDDYCIAYMFTHRDFEDGVLGLAWVASSGKDSGGLCTKCKVYDTLKSRCLNTGIVTTKNVKEVPALQSYLTFGHELGHNLGSPHDPAMCSPGSGNGGNFLMYPHANTGHDPNNKKLSECSREIMGPILSIRATCFEDNPDVCGDFKKDEDEQCDCGDTIHCDQDKCCDGQSCTFKDPSYTCSSMDGVCCNALTCQPYATDTKAQEVTCFEATECKEAVKCEAGSFACPVDREEYFKKGEDGAPVLCNKGTQVCKDGECQDSLCVFANTVSCQCTEVENKCKLCCEKEIDGIVQCLVSNHTVFDGTELETAIGGQAPYLLPGSVCGDDMGYCDILNICRIVDADGPIASLGNYIFNGVLFDSARNLAVAYWYYCIMLAIGMVCFMTAFIAVCSKTVKPPQNLPRGGERMSYPSSHVHKHVTHPHHIEMRHNHL